MKYAILSNGEEYIVVVKKFLFWVALKDFYWEGDISQFGVIKFNKQIKAETYAKEQLGIRAKRIRTWGVV